MLQCVHLLFKNHIYVIHTSCLNTDFAYTYILIITTNIHAYRQTDRRTIYIHAYHTYHTNRDVLVSGDVCVALFSGEEKMCQLYFHTCFVEVSICTYIHKYIHSFCLFM